MKKERKRQPLPILVGVLLLCVCAASWGMVLFGHQQEAEGFAERKAKAEELFDKQIYDDALREYKVCLEIAPGDLFCMERVAELYHLTGQDNSCIAWCERVLRTDPGNRNAALLEAQSYDSQKKVRSAISVLRRAKKAAPLTDEMNTFLLELKGRYELTYFTFSAVFPWFFLPDGSQAATVADEEGLRIVNSAGKDVLVGSWSFLGQCADDELLFPVKEGDTGYYVDEKGARRLVPDKACSALYSFSEGFAPASHDGKAGYLDKTMKEQRFEFQETLPMSEGHALARKDNTWFVLDSSLQEVTACPFAEVKKDVYRNSLKYGLIIGRLSQEKETDAPQWGLFTPDAVRVGDFVSDDLRLPEEKGAPLAFCREGKWGFVKPDGTVLLDPVFEDARSFSKGLAAVRKDGKWGYVDKTGAWIIPPTFEDAGPFSEAGTAFVKNHAGYSLLMLSRYIA